MKLSGVTSFVALGVFFSTIARAADAAKVDYSERNTLFAPAAGVVPDQRAPQTNESLQNRRVKPVTIDKKDSVVGDRRAPIDLAEAREKNVIGKDSHRPETRERELSSFDRRESRIRTSDQREKPPLVMRYQASLTSASATNMSRFPALDQATTARVNRFVFRKNEAVGSLAAAAVVPAGGGDAPQSPRSPR